MRRKHNTPNVTVILPGEHASLAEFRLDFVDAEMLAVLAAVAAGVSGHCS
jgi:hypothetical protein